MARLNEQFADMVRAVGDGSANHHSGRDHADQRPTQRDRHYAARILTNALPLRDGCQRTQSVVHRLRVREQSGNIGIEHNYVGTIRILCCVLPANPSTQVILWEDLVGI